MVGNNLIIAGLSKVGMSVSLIKAIAAAETKGLKVVIVSDERQLPTMDECPKIPKECFCIRTPDLAEEFVDLKTDHSSKPWHKDARYKFKRKR